MHAEVLIGAELSCVVQLYLHLQQNVSDMICPTSQYSHFPVDQETADRRLHSGGKKLSCLLSRESRTFASQARFLPVPS